MYVLLTSVFLASLLGSLHCLGMCGGFVAFYAGDSVEQKAAWWGHATYSFGRWIAYTSLGLLVGGAGAALNLVGQSAGLQWAAAWIGGSLMILWGLGMLLHQHNPWASRFKAPLWLQRWVLRRHRSMAEKTPAMRGFALGLLSAALPCGWLYAFVLTAAATGSPWAGGLVMTAFWMGTLPAMLGLGVALHKLSARLRTAIPTLSAVAILVMGLFTLWQRAHIPLAIPSTSALQRARRSSPQQHLQRLQRVAPRCNCSKKP